MVNYRIHYIVVDARVDGKRKAGRPKFIWLNDVQKDFKII